MRKRLSTPKGKKEYAKRIMVAKAPFGNMKVNKRWNQLSHRGFGKVKGECVLHVIGHNRGVICRNVSIEEVENLNSIRGQSKSLKYSVDDGLFSSFLPETLGVCCSYDSMFDECYCGFVKNGFQIIGSGLAT